MQLHQKTTEIRGKNLIMCNTSLFYFSLVVVVDDVVWIRDSKVVISDMITILTVWMDINPHSECEVQRPDSLSAKLNKD